MLLLHLRLVLVYLLVVHLNISNFVTSSCINYRTAVQSSEINYYWVSSVSIGSGANTYDGNVGTNLVTGASHPPDNGVHFVLLRHTNFVIINTITVNFNNNNFNKVYVSATDPAIVSGYAQNDAKLTAANWTSYTTNNSICNTGTTTGTGPYTVTVSCNTITKTPTKYILVTFNITETVAPYSKMDINEVSYSVVDLNTPLSPPSPAASWLVTCSGNLATPSCSDYVICSTTSSSCWSSSYITLTDVVSADPRGPYYCRLTSLPNQTSFSGLTAASASVTWFYNPATPTLTYTNVTTSNTATYTFTCKSLSSLPDTTHTVTVNTSKINGCHSETASVTAQTTGSYGGKEATTTKTLTVCLNATVIKFEAFCQTSQNGFNKGNVLATVVYKVDGGWSDWTNGSCSVSCGGGNRTDTRECNNPAPEGVGQTCMGNSKRAVECNTYVCPENNILTSKNTSLDPSIAAAVAGGSIGALILLIVIIIIIVVVMKKKGHNFGSYLAKVFPKPKDDKPKANKQSPKNGNGQMYSDKSNEIVCIYDNTTQGHDNEMFSPEETEYATVDGDKNVKHYNDNVQPTLQLAPQVRHPPPEIRSDIEMNNFDGGCTYADLDKSALNIPSNKEEFRDSTNQDHVVYADIVGVMKV